MNGFYIRAYRTVLVVWVGVWGLTIAGCGSDSKDSPGNAILLNDNNGADYNPVIHPADFQDNNGDPLPIDNPFLTLKQGNKRTYKSKDGKEKVELEVTDIAKTILGVTVTVVKDQEFEDDEMVEDTQDWFAQDKDGNVWYFGEDTKELEDGKVTSTAGSWEAGKKGAKPGLIMKGNPQVGDAYRQEFFQGEAEDMAEVLSLSAPVTIGLGSYANCLQTKEWSPLAPEVVEHKFYCKQVGTLVLAEKVVGGVGGEELTAISP